MKLNLRSPYIVMPIITLLVVFGWSILTRESSAIEYDKVKSGDNLIKNPSFDKWDNSKKPNNWSLVSENENEVLVEKGQGVVDKSSVKVDVKNFIKSSTSILSDEIAISSNKQYDLKAYYISDTTSSLLIKETNKEGVSSYRLLNNYPDFDYPHSAMSARFFTKPDTVNLQVMISISGKGFIEIDYSYLKLSEDQDLPIIESRSSLIKPEKWATKSSDTFNTNSYIDNEKQHFITEKKDQTFGLAGWTPELVQVRPHQYYKYTFEYLTDNEASVVIDYLLKDGNYRYEIVDVAPSNSYMSEYSVLIDIPSDVVAIQPSLQVNSGRLVHKTPDLFLISDSDNFDEARISITFDDGLYTSYLNGADVLEQNDMRATYYINPGLIGKNRYMSRGDLNELLARGHQIGSHTNIHTDITILEKKALDNDLKKANRYINDLGVNRIDFASPYGKYDQVSLDIIKRNQSSHRGTKLGINTKQNFNKNELRGLFIRKTTKDDDLRKQLQDTKLKKGWIILIYHDIELNSSDFSIDRETFERHIKIVQESGIPVATVDSVLKNIES